MRVLDARWHRCEVGVVDECHAVGRQFDLPDLARYNIDLDMYQRVEREYEVEIVWHHLERHAVVLRNVACLASIKLALQASTHSGDRSTPPNRFA
jgi:hypothetical protein